MRATTSLAIPQPCAENWAAMSPTATGRHCAACAKTVVDFTLKNDAEILAYLAGAAAGRTCGRFAAGQLERPLQRAASAAPNGRWRAWLAAAVAVWGLREAGGTNAQAQVPVEMHRQIDKPSAMLPNLQAERKPEYKGPQARKIILRGVIKDYRTREDLPGVTVAIRGARLGASTNLEGTFELVIPADSVATGFVELEVFSVGYVSQQRRVLLTDAEQPIQFLLQAAVKGGLEITIAPPAPWRPRAFYYWTKYWVTRPFRRS